MSKRPRYPGRPKVPGTFRTHERKGPDPYAEAQRIALYLPIAALDRAERQAMRARVESVQRYCELVLLREIEQQDDREHREEEAIRRERLDDLRTIADDPDYLAEWTATMLDRVRAPEAGGGVSSAPALGPGAAADARGPSGGAPGPPGSAAEVVLRHAGMIGDDPEGLLAVLRRGGEVAPGAGQELLRALAELEAEHRGAPAITRPLGYALHRLAFEGQVLVGEGGAASAVGEATVGLLRLVQEGVDRVLSGQDIRYYTSHDRCIPIDG